MIPMEPGPEDFARILSERRADMERSRAFARYAHSQTGLLFRHLRRLTFRETPSPRRGEISESKRAERADRPAPGAQGRGEG